VDRSCIGKVVSGLPNSARRFGSSTNKLKHVENPMSQKTSLRRRRTLSQTGILPKNPSRVCVRVHSRPARGRCVSVEFAVNAKVNLAHPDR
jgi:hypothetical protein